MKSRSRDTSSLRCTRVYSKFYGACPKVLGCKSNIAWSVRSKNRVDYVALINLIRRILKQLVKAKGNINPGKRFIKWKDLSAGTVIGDQIINESDVVRSAYFKIALVNVPMPFLQKIIRYFNWQSNLRFVNIFPAAIIFCWVANSKISLGLAFHDRLINQSWFEL